MFLLNNIDKMYGDIHTNDFKSLKTFKEKKNFSGLRESNLERLSALRKKEEELFKRERELEEKLINANEISEDEYKLLESLKAKRDLISKNKVGILKGLQYSKIDKKDKERLDKENEIEEIKKSIKENIDELTHLIKRVEENNFGIERLNGLSVQDKHIAEFNSIIDRYGKKNFGERVSVDARIYDVIDRVFKNNLEIRIDMFKDIYEEAIKTIHSYKRHEEINFDKIRELNELYNSRLWDATYTSINPYIDINIVDWEIRHLNAYADIVEQINHVNKGEYSMEQITELRDYIYNENLKADMPHKYFMFSDLNQYLKAVYNRQLEESYTEAVRKM